MDKSWGGGTQAIPTGRWHDPVYMETRQLY